MVGFRGQIHHREGAFVQREAGDQEYPHADKLYPF